MQSLADKWNNYNEMQVAELIPLLSIHRVFEKPSLESIGDEDEIAGDYIDNAAKRRLAAIVEHPAFKVLLDDKQFTKIYLWIDSENAPKEYKTLDAKIRLLESIVISFTQYVRVSKGYKKLYHQSDAKKEIAKILNKIKKNQGQWSSLSNKLGDPLCHEISGSLQFHIECMEQYQVPILPNRTEGFDDNVFLWSLISWLLWHQLPRDVEFIRKVLELDDCISVGYYDNNLDKKISEVERKLSKNDVEREELRSKLRQKFFYKVWK